ncbi:hypothetical protein RclHR1_02520006 [Rhizophagus clarus]|uniref:Uncharacterized protein n=1 Tax=Rhizophagus clarus TaxID=94130 RepID=A0A2Z6REM8_9GLOM|nr:hypothetical protein RclHR1_02520006 [Rhizophagus clarus]
MSDNTKLKPRLRYSPTLGCIIGSVLSKEETIINTYSDIPNVINKIKSERAIAKDVRAYILQIPLPKFPPIVIALIPNKGNDNSKTIGQLHRKLIQEIAPQLGIHILSIGSDGAITEFQAQQSIIDIQTSKRLSVREPSLNIHFSCPVFDNIGPIVQVQDPKHAKKTARNAIISGARLLTFGTSSVRYDHFLTLINQHNSIMYKNDVIKLDKQDDAAAYRTFVLQTLSNVLHMNLNYLNRNISPVERIRMALTSYFFLHLWHFHIKTLHRKYPDFVSIRQNFLSDQSFAILTSLCESMVLLIKAYRDYYPQIPFLPWLHGSESCEHFFGVARQINSDFDFFELIQMLPKISQYAKALRHKKLSFDKERSHIIICLGYLFDFTSDELDKLSIDKLRLWPDDEQILKTIQLSHHLARDLAEYVGIVQPSDISIDIIIPQISIESNEIDISGSSIEKQPNEFNDENIDNEEYDLSSAISEASSEMKRITIEPGNEEQNSNDFIEGRSQLNEIDQPPDNLYILNNGDSVLYNQRKLHEAYCSKPLERKFKIVGANSRISEETSLIQPNKASHIVAYFTKNENPEQRFVTQREKRWKDNQKNVAITLAQLYAQELTKSKKERKSNKRNAQEGLIEIPNIETANICTNFPLMTGDYVFVRYGLQMCIGRVEALYFEAYNHHCYTQEAIKDLNDISYISLHVFIPLHLELFTDKVKEGCYILTHQIPSNIIYHIKPDGAVVEGNFLRLVGNEKQYYFNYFGREDIIKKMVE